jgi:cation diffusion facilitator family transporter
MSQTQNEGNPNGFAAVKAKAALLSVGASVVLTIGKTVAAVLSGSLALYSEAIHGLIDIAATLTTYFALRVADKPADDEHHYGHGKVESLAALAETALLFALAGAVAWEAGNRLWGGQTSVVQVTPLVIGVLLASILIDATRWRALSLVAKETNSEALAADALHFSSDLVSSSMALAGLIAVKMGYPMGDTIAALGVALFIVVAAWRLARRTINTLIDAAPAGMATRMRDAVEAVPGIVAIDWLKLRPAGGISHGELGVRISRTLPFDEVAVIKNRLAAAIAAVEPTAEVTITANPIQLDDETVFDRVMLIAARQRIAVHHLTVHNRQGKLSVSLDMEVDSKMTHGAAHDIATRLETAIRAEFGIETEVETHIEPMEIEAPSSQDADVNVVGTMTRDLEREAAKGTIIEDVHSVRVRKIEGGLVVNYHCRVDPALDVATVHTAVDVIERALRVARPEVKRLVSHAEPVKPKV